jgi:hypothetical protein
MRERCRGGKPLIGRNHNHKEKGKERENKEPRNIKQEREVEL